MQTLFPYALHMGDDRFIAGQMSLWLDLVRGLAALMVLVGHSVQVGLYTGPYPFTIMAQHNAVIVFFVLSGLVISSSVQSGDATLHSYAIARAARILPVAIPAVAFAALAYLIGAGSEAAKIHPPAYAELSPQGLLLPLLFLSESAYGSGPVWNPPYWSLCYEMWFYALFGAAIFLRGWHRAVALGLFALLAGLKILLLLPIWLIGVWLNHSRLARCLPPAAFPFIAAAAAIFPFASSLTEHVAARLMVLTGLTSNDLGFSVYVLRDYILALLVALSFAALRTVATSGLALPRVWERPIRNFAGFTFTLYLMHWPLLMLLRSFGVTSGSNPFGFLLLLLLAVASCAAVARFTEHKRRAVRSFLEAALSRKPNLAFAAPPTFPRPRMHGFSRSSVPSSANPPGTPPNPDR